MGKFLTFLFAIASAVYLSKVMLLYSGYCFEKERYLTTQEKFDVVVAEIIREDKLSYATLEEFYAANPNSCELVERFRHPDETFIISFMDRASGRLNIFVRVFYVYDFDRQNNVPLYAEKYFGISNCGKLWTSKEIIKHHDSIFF